MKSTVIRANDRGAAAQHVPFNFDDMAAQAARYLDKVRADAGAILAQAVQDAAKVRQQAEIEGRAAGQRAVAQMVAEQMAQQMKTVLPALRESISQIQHAKQSWLSHWEKTAIHVATAIAGRILRRSIADHPEVTLALVRETLELTAGSAQIRIRLNPEDHQALGQQVAALTNEFTTVAATEIIADPEISRGGCRTETRFGMIDQQLESQLARIEEELT